MFDRLIRASLAQRALVLGMACVLLVAGWLAAQRTAVDVFPDLNKPTVTVLTEAGALAPEEVEALVSQPLERALNGMPSVTRLRSVSGIGLSVVFAEFDWGSDIYRNRQLVAERLASARAQLPAGVEPQLGPVASIMGEIMLLALPVDAGAGEVAAYDARDHADWVMRPALMAIPGVAQVIPIGGRVRQYRVAPDPLRMQAVGVSLEQVQAALRQFGAAASGGFLEQQGRELMVRALGRSLRLDDLRQLSVAWREGRPIRLDQVAEVAFAARTPRGDAGFDGAPAVILSIQKQPGADTVSLSRRIEAALAALAPARPASVAEPVVLFRQADFIERSIGNVRSALAEGAFMVLLVLWCFLANVRTTAISLAAIPLSLLAATLVFHALGMTLNTMTLGGLAIAIGELVDDAVVDVENMLRRLRANARLAQPLPALEVVARACAEVRSGVVIATLIVILVFVPLFFLPGMEGRLFVPLGLAYVIAILASLAVALTVTPVLGLLLLARLPARAHDDTWLAACLKRGQERVLRAAFGRSGWVLGTTGALVLVAAISVPWLPRSFLPPFNEGSFTVNLALPPGVSLAVSNDIGRLAEERIAALDGVLHVGRRTGRAELDEHAEGVHNSELEVAIAPGVHERAHWLALLRGALADLPASVAVGQPIAHRLDHLLSGVRAQIAIKLFGDDLDALRGQGEALLARLRALPGLADLQLERQVRVPQLRVEVDHDAAARYGIAPGQVVALVEAASGGATLGQVLDGARRIDLTLRLDEADRTPGSLAGVMVDTPAARVPLGRLARIVEGDGPNQIGRENARRRIVISANASGNLSEAVDGVRAVLAQAPVGAGVVLLEGQFQAQEQALGLMRWLGGASLLLIFLVLFSRYRSVRLALIVMASIPLALVGAVAALWLSGDTLSVASVVGFITLAGIASRNGVLKLSHYINLCLFEGEVFCRDMILRGSRERLVPVLMTALTAALALLPLVVAHEAPGKEILHPVAVVIFGGLVSSTLLDSLITPLMFHRWGEPALRRLLDARPAAAL